MIKLNIKKFRLEMLELLSSFRLSQEDSNILLDHLFLAERYRCGSYGFATLPYHLNGLKNGSINPSSNLSASNLSNNILSIDGKWGLGHVIAEKSSKLLTELAKKEGLACAIVKNCNYIGMLSQYGDFMAKKNCAGIIMSNGHGSGIIVAPHEGINKRLSTNPICFFCKASPFNLVCDFSTSECGGSRFKIQHSNLAENEFSIKKEDVLINPNKPLEDINNALKTFGGFKGYALSFFVDIFAGGLIGDNMSGISNKYGNGIFMIAIDLKKFDDNLNQRLQRFIEWVASSDSKNDIKVPVPGERRHQTQEQEFLSIHPSILSSIRKFKA